MNEFTAYLIGFSNCKDPRWYTSFTIRRKLWRKSSSNSLSFIVSNWSRAENLNSLRRKQRLTIKWDVKTVRDWKMCARGSEWEREGKKRERERERGRAPMLIGDSTRVLMYVFLVCASPPLLFSGPLAEPDLCHHLPAKHFLLPRWQSGKQGRTKI